MMFSRALRFFNTIKYLTVEQLYWQVRYRLYRKKVRIEKVNFALRSRKRCNGGVYFLGKSSTMAGNFFSALNIGRECHFPEDWNNQTLDALWLYHLHYFDFLLNDSASEEDKLQAILRWIKENDNLKGVGWEPYPISLRVVNWIKWCLLQDQLDSAILNSLYLQATYLSYNIEYHISGNHLLSNIKALIFSGLFFDTPKADVWYHKGVSLLSKELSRQIMPEGGHYELSPMYHNIVLEDVLDLFYLHQLYHKEPPLDLVAPISKMLGWACDMVHPDLNLAFFNDVALNMARSYSELAGYAKNLGIDRALTNQSISDRDGYIVVRKGPFDLKIDAAEIGARTQPGHAHADTLSFELSVGQKRVFVNSGISTYHDVVLRAAQRATRSHNTLEISGENSSEVWSKFRVARRANILHRNMVRDDNGRVSVIAAHDGYARLKGSPMHQRSFEVLDNEIRITDQVQSTVPYPLKLYFYLNPEAKIEVIDDRTCILLLENRILFKSSFPMRIQDTCYYPEFNRSCPNQCLLIKENMKGPVFENKVSIKVVSS